MGSIFRKSTTRPVPSGATISGSGTKLKARWKGRGHREKWQTAKVFTLEDGRRVVRQKSETFFARYRDYDGTLVTFSTGCRDKTNAKKVLEAREEIVERVKAGRMSAEEAAISLQPARSILDHLGDFLSTMMGSAMHRKNTDTCCRRLIADCGWRNLSDMKKFDLERWLADQARAGRSVRSRNSFQTAVVTFVNWCIGDTRWTTNPFSGMKKPREETDPRRPRRALTPEELGALIRAAQDAPGRPPVEPGRSTRQPALRLSGRDRGDLYLFLTATGARVGEAKQLDVADIYLDSRIPVVKLRAATTKNGESADIPLREDVVAMLRRRLQTRGYSEKVFDIPSDLIRRFHGDCKRAGIPRYDERGYQIDLHSLRKTFGTFLALSGVPLTITQRLMRHGDPGLTSNLYTDIRLVEMHGAVEAIPHVTLSPPLDSGSATESSSGDAAVIPIAS